MLNLPPFKSRYTYDPPPAQSTWHLVFDQPAGQNEHAAGGFRDDDVVFIDYATKKSLTFGKLRTLSKQLAYGLLHKIDGGLRAGDTVLLFANNTVWYPAFVYGTQAAGLTCTLANPKYTQDDLSHHLKDSGATVFVYDRMGAAIAEAVCDQAGVPSNRRFIIDRDDGKGDVKSIWALCGKEEHEPKRLKGEELDKTAIICYSSGTTGKPKGVITTHSNLWHVCHQVQATWPLLPEHGPLVGFLPLYHMYGCLWLMFHAARHHQKTVIFPGFIPDAILQVIQDYKVTMLHSVPPVVLFLAQSPMVEKYDLSSLKYVMCGAAPLGIELIDACEKKLGVKVVGGYGMTETTCYATSDMPETRIKASVGQLIAGIEGRVVDGELQLRGPNMTPGYHNRPDANTDLFAEDDKGGRWLRTGDLVEADENNNFWVTDRMKELIKYKAMQVAPAELEDLLVTHPKVADACVTAAARPEEATEVPRAFVQLKTGNSDTSQVALEIRDWANAKLADYKRLRGGIVFVEAIPKNPSGKLLRRVLREMKNSKVHGEMRTTRSGEAKL